MTDFAEFYEKFVLEEFDIEKNAAGRTLVDVRILDAIQAVIMVVVRRAIDEGDPPSPDFLKGIMYCAEFYEYAKELIHENVPSDQMPDTVEEMFRKI